MNPFLTYIIKTAFCIAAFYLVYSLMLSRDTMYTRNRIFILFAVISALVLPFISIETNKPVGSLFFGKTLSEVLIKDSSAGNPMESGVFAAGLPKILLAIYFAGLLLFGMILLFNLAELFILIIKRRSAGSRLIKFHGLATAGFSALGYVFINSRLSESDAAEILRHEQNHQVHFHFLDILFLEVVKVLQWFNPFIHLFDRSLRAVHEYQADEECIRNGIPILSYQQLLMNQVFRARVFNITNSFSNPTLIKKRMIMMTKKRSTTMANLKILMVLPVIAIVLVAFSSCQNKAKQTANATEEIAPPPPPPPPVAAADKKVEAGQPIPADAPPPPPPPPPPPFTVKDGDTTWHRVDVMPQFTGGDVALTNYIEDNITYPPAAKEKNIQGKVLVSFIVKQDGTVTGAKVAGGSGMNKPELCAEAVRVVSSLPAFEKPGLKNGKPVQVWYMMPIAFTLK